VVAVLVAIQFIRPEPNHGVADTPRDITHAVQVPANVVQEGHMPLPPYLYTHDDAKVSPAQVRLIVDWVKSERGKLAVGGK
jgi:hypothetical protein